MKRKASFVLVTLSALVFFSSAAVALTIASSHFDSGDDGWTGSGISFTWESAGGNPGGYMQFNNNISGYVNAKIVAPAHYIGNWTELGVTDIFYDAKIFQTGGYIRRSFYRVRLFGSSGEAYWNGPSAPAAATDWVPLNANIIQSEWTVNAGTWEAILADVTSFEIAMAYYTNTRPFEITGVDNVRLVSAVGSVPEPGTMILLGSGLVVLAGYRRKLKKLAPH